jgi:hypothetical protein
MQENYKEIIQAVLEGKQLQFRAADTNDSWVDDHKNAGSISDISRILREFFTLGGSEYQVKPEKKVFKYQTRSYLAQKSKREAVVVWTSTDYCTQQMVGDSSSFLRWLEPTQDRKVVYE